MPTPFADPDASGLDGETRSPKDGGSRRQPHPAPLELRSQRGWSAHSGQLRAAGRSPRRPRPSPSARPGRPGPPHRLRPLREAGGRLGNLLGSARAAPAVGGGCAAGAGRVRGSGTGDQATRDGSTHRAARPQAAESGLGTRAPGSVATREAGRGAGRHRPLPPPPLPPSALRSPPPRPPAPRPDLPAARANPRGGRPLGRRAWAAGPAGRGAASPRILAFPG